MDLALLLGMRVLLMCVCGLLGLQVVGCQVASSGGPGMNMLPDGGPGADGSRPDVSLPDGSLPPSTQALRVQSVRVRFVQGGQTVEETVPLSAISLTSAGLVVDRGSASTPYQVTISGASLAGLSSIDEVAYRQLVQRALRGVPATLSAGNDGTLEGSVTLRSGGSPTAYTSELTSGDITVSRVSPDIDRDGLRNHLDPDMDGDGIANASDPDIDGDGLLNAADLDRFGLGYPDRWDLDGDRILNGLETDTDGDGIVDRCDPMPYGNSAGSGGVPPAGGGIPTDVDGDGRPNQNCAPDVWDHDDDNDGYIDNSSAANGAPGDWVLNFPSDMDGDGIPNLEDLDDDNDGRPEYNGVPGSGTVNLSEYTPYPFTPFQGFSVDNDNDGIPNQLDTDDDNDGEVDWLDAVPHIHWRDFDVDHDGMPNNGDSDADGDGMPNAGDPTPFGQLDADRDGMPDSVDDDDDGDGVPDGSDLDRDGDGIPNAMDTQQSDTDYDGDGQPNSSDLDNDNDGLPDVEDISPLVRAGFFVDTDRDGTPDYLDLDRDGDGMPDYLGSDGQPALESDADGQPNDMTPYGTTFSGSIFHNQSVGIFFNNFEMIFDFTAEDTLD